MCTLSYSHFVIFVEKGITLMTMISKQFMFLYVFEIGNTLYITVYGEYVSDHYKILGMTRPITLL